MLETVSWTAVSQERSGDTEVCREPAARLMLAVLEDAMVSFQRGLNSPIPAQRSEFHEVDAWLASEDTDWTFSFENICTTLSINPDYIRTGLRRLKRRALATDSRVKTRKARRGQIYDRRGWTGQIR